MRAYTYVLTAVAKVPLSFFFFSSHRSTHIALHPFFDAIEWQTQEEAVISLSLFSSPHSQAIGMDQKHTVEEWDNYT